MSKIKIYTLRQICEMHNKIIYNNQKPQVYPAFFERFLKKLFRIKEILKPFNKSSNFLLEQCKTPTYFLNRKNK